MNRACQNVIALFLIPLLAAGLAAQDKRLVFSTFQGGDRNDDANSVAVDPAGFVYVTGETESRDLAANPVGGKPLTAAVFKGYLTKYSPGGKQVLWRVLIGGSSNTVPRAVALDSTGNVYVAGTTGARDLPMINPVQSQQTGLNIAFLMQFDPQGKLLFSTYFGGNRNEEGLALAIDSKDNVYLAGRATSTDLPVKNALQATLGGGGQDAFIAKYTPDHRLAYATYLGGTAGTDNIASIAVGPGDSLFVTGESMSPNLASENAYIRTAQPYSSYVAKIAPDGGAVTYFTYIGWRGGYTVARGVAVDSQGRAHVVGQTSSKQLPVTTGAIQSTFAGGFRDAFLLRLNAEGSMAEYLTYLGGSTKGAADPDEVANAVRIDTHGHVYVAGETVSPDFLGRREVQAAHGGAQDAFLMRLDLDTSQVLYSTFWGGDKRDAGSALALGPGEAATLVGESYSPNLPVANAAQPRLASLNDAFVAQICDPWLGSFPQAALQMQKGSAQAMDLDVFSGCTQPFDAVEIAASEPWLTITPSARTVPMKLSLRVNPEGLAEGEHKATIRVTVNEAFHRTLEIPVTLTVTE